MPQTTMSDFPAAALEGMEGPAYFPRTALSRAVETAAGVGPGRLLLRGASDETAKIPAGDVAVPLGFTLLRNSDVEGGASVMFAQYSGVSLLRAGMIWLHCVGAIAPGDVIAIIHTGANAGRPAVSGTANSTVIGGLTCLQGATDDLGLFEVHLTAGARGPTGPTGPTGP